MSTNNTFQFFSSAKITLYVHGSVIRTNTLLRVNGDSSLPNMTLSYGWNDLYEANEDKFDMSSCENVDLTNLMVANAMFINVKKLINSITKDLNDGSLLIEDVEKTYPGLKVY